MDWSPNRVVPVVDLLTLTAILESDRMNRWMAEWAVADGSTAMTRHTMLMHLRRHTGCVECMVGTVSGTKGRAFDDVKFGRLLLLRVWPFPDGVQPYSIDSPCSRCRARI